MGQLHFSLGERLKCMRPCEGTGNLGRFVPARPISSLLSQGRGNPAAAFTLSERAGDCGARSGLRSAGRRLHPWAQSRHTPFPQGPWWPGARCPQPPETHSCGGARTHDQPILAWNSGSPSPTCCLPFSKWIVQKYQFHDKKKMLKTSHHQKIKIH